MICFILFENKALGTSDLSIEAYRKYINQLNSWQMLSTNLKINVLNLVFDKTLEIINKYVLYL